jgi:surface antigen
MRKLFGGNFMLTSRNLGAAARVAIAAVVALAVVAGGLIAAPAAFAGTDDYPAKWKSIPRDSTFDDWGEYNRECTSWVAWRLHGRNHFEMPFHANADKWGPRAQALGYTVNTTPAVGAVAWWSSMHVAWVEAVNPDGTVTIEEYNIGGKGRYDETIIPASRPTGYIHFQDIATTFNDGDYISYNSNVYRMAGGAPIYVSSWAKWGKKPVGLASTSQWSKLLQVPADGTFIRARSSMKVYQIVGGAPVYISNWDIVGGKKPVVVVQDASIANAAASNSAWHHLNFFPAGTVYVTASPSKQVYKIDGGTAVPVPTPAATGGTTGSTTTTAAAATPVPTLTIGDDNIQKAGAELANPYGHLHGLITPSVPTIRGLAKEGHTLKVSVGTWAPSDVTLTYRWMRNGVTIKNATAATYLLNWHNHGAVITVRVTASKSNYRTEVSVSAGTAKVIR